MERIDAFEKMLSDIQKQYEQEETLLATLKASGKEKSATFRQHLGNHLLHGSMLELYKAYGLMPADNSTTC